MYILFKMRQIQNLFYWTLNPKIDKIINSGNKIETTTFRNDYYKNNELFKVPLGFKLCVKIIRYF